MAACQESAFTKRECITWWVQLVDAIHWLNLSAGVFALMSPPTLNQTRYHGVFASNSKLRSLINKPYNISLVKFTSIDRYNCSIAALGFDANSGKNVDII